MFECLFGDEGDAKTSSTKTSSSSSGNGKQNSVSSPPQSRMAGGLAGIDNQGATCYMNALLQSLLYTPEFRGMCVL